MNRTAVLLSYALSAVSALLALRAPDEFSDLARFPLISNRVIIRRICSQDCGFSVRPISRDPSISGPEEEQVLRRHRPPPSSPAEQRELRVQPRLSLPSNPAFRIIKELQVVVYEGPLKRAVHVSS